MPSKPHKPKGLGDLVAGALATVGITEERLSGWLGRPCNCRQRRDKLNRLSDWALRVLRGSPPVEEAVNELALLTEDPTLTQPQPVAEPPKEP